MKTKINKLDKKIPDATTLIHISQCNADKQSLEKNWRCWSKIPDVSGLVTTTVFNTKIGLIKKTDYDAKISEIEKKTLDHNHDKYITS